MNRGSIGIEDNRRDETNRDRSFLGTVSSSSTFRGQEKARRR